MDTIDRLRTAVITPVRPQETLAAYPMLVPRAARKRLMALSELVRLQMKAEEDKATTAIEVCVDK